MSEEVKFNKNQLLKGKNIKTILILKNIYLLKSKIKNKNVHIKLRYPLYMYK